MLTSLESCLNLLNPAADLTTLLLGARIEGQTIQMLLHFRTSEEKCCLPEVTFSLAILFMAESDPTEKEFER